MTIRRRRRRRRVATLCSGHSLGEYVAAVFSGALDCATAAALVCERGRLIARLAQPSARH